MSLKVLVRVVASQIGLHEHLACDKLLHHGQHGLTISRSTSTNLLECLNDWTLQGGPVKTAHFWKLELVYMTTQKGDKWITLFSTLSRVRTSFWMLLQLNILCTTLVKTYYTKNNDSPLFAVDMLGRLYVFSNVLNFIKTVTFIYQNAVELCTKNVSSRLPRPWSPEARFVTLMGGGPSNQNAIKGMPD